MGNDPVSPRATSQPPEPFSPDLAERSERLGPYRLLRVIGEGGMGIVYEAEQLEPMHRLVAVKIVRAGMSSREVLARFEAEQQALAVMNHPNIARVFDAGSAPDARPYFVMELVKGVPLTDFCDANRLTVRERVELMIRVCEAVQHAHQKGVIHRDLKPSNVLVADQNGATPKIIDFGIAKALSQRLTERTLVTAYGQSMGTPAYMSPEQAEQTGLDVDTRADIYSLGVMLYEVLVGRLPVDPEEVGYSSFMLALTGRGNDPPLPSARLAQLADSAGGIAALRRSDAQALRRQLRRDLDWIVMKAIEKERGRRYETANALAMDLRRYLDDEPIVARPPSAGYRIRKLVRRNRAAALALALAGTSVAAGASASMVGFVRARRAERVARREAEAAARTSDFLVGLFGVANPDAHTADRLTVRQLLDSGAARIDRELSAQPVIRGRLLRTMGTAYTGLGVYDRGEALLREALEVRRAARPMDSAAVAESSNDLGRLLIQRGRLVEAESLLTQSVEMRAKLPGVSDSVRASGEYQLGMLEFMRDNPAGARRHAAAVLARLVRPSGDTLAPFLTINARVLLGIAFVQESRYDSAAAAFRAAFQSARARLGASNSTAFGAENNLALAERHLMHFAAAESLLVDLVPRVRDVYGATSARYSTTLGNLADLYVDEGRLVEAERLLEEATSIDRRMLDPDSPDAAQSLLSLADVYAQTHRTNAADSLYRHVLRIQVKSLAPGSADIRETVSKYAGLLRATGRAGEASALERRYARAPR